MKKAEALLKIESSPEVIKILGQRSFPSDSHGRVTGYDISVMVTLDSAIATNTTYTFYVVDEGQPEEVAYWKQGRQPQSEQQQSSSVSFKDKLKAFYPQVKASDPNVLAAYANPADIDEDGEFAVVTIVFKDPTWDGNMPMPETIKVKFDVGTNPDGSIWYAAQDRALMQQHNL